MLTKGRSRAPRCKLESPVTFDRNICNSSGNRWQLFTRTQCTTGVHHPPCSQECTEWFVHSLKIGVHKVPMFTKCRCSQTQTKELSYLVRSDSDPATCVFSHLGFASWFCALGWQPAMDRGRDEARGGEARQPTRHYQERGGDERRGDDADDRYCYPRRREDHREEEERAHRDKRRRRSPSRSCSPVRRRRPSRSPSPDARRGERIRWGGDGRRNEDDLEV